MARRGTSAGFLTDRIGRVHDVLAGYVERGHVPGMVGLVNRGEEVHVEVLGAQSLGGTPMRRDTIFRVASLTKPIAAVAVLTLVEECRLRLDDPVDRWLPEMAERRVLQELASPLDDTVPAHRPITLRDLLTFRMGFGVLLAPPGTYPIQTAIDELGIGNGPPNPATFPRSDEWLRRLGTLPLMYQPGERWVYDTAFDVLGVLLERASGQSLETLLHERIFEPLGMHDTGFSVSDDKSNRFATSYQVNDDTGQLEVYDPAVQGQWNQQPAFFSAAGGLVSTADDYFSFARMLLNNGEYRGQRILSRPTVETMTMNHLTAEQQSLADFILPDNCGWGMGMSIITRRDDPFGPVGSYGWTGGLGTMWQSDPSEDMVTILLTQRMFASPTDLDIFRDFMTSAYQAISD